MFPLAQQLRHFKMAFMEITRMDAPMPPYFYPKTVSDWLFLTSGMVKSCTSELSDSKGVTENHEMMEMHSR